MTDHGERYTTVAIVLHWVIALLILSNIATGFVMEGLGPEWKPAVLAFHFSSGITVLALSLVRIAWRLTHRPPEFPAGFKVWERRAAHGAHALLYVLMIVMPILGWSIISAHPPRPQGAATLWGFLRLPALSPISHLAEPAQKAAHGAFVAAHSAGAWILAGLLVLHVAGALKHQWFDRHPVLARLGVGRQRRGLC
jgi:cytochrome b561